MRRMTCPYCANETPVLVTPGLRRFCCERQRQHWYIRLGINPKVPIADDIVGYVQQKIDCALAILEDIAELTGPTGFRRI